MIFELKVLLFDCFQIVQSFMLGVVKAKGRAIISKTLSIGELKENGI